jgi:hypothetical protein
MTQVIVWVVVSIRPQASDCVRGKVHVRVRVSLKLGLG